MSPPKNFSNKSRSVPVWSRLIPARWEDAWLERLAWTGSQNCVSTRLAGHSTCRLEVYGMDAAGLRKLKREFGGTVSQKKNSAWMITQKREFFLPLPPRLCLSDSDVKVPAKYRQLPRLVIPAGMAFGSGEHATTAMCLRQLVKNMPSMPGRMLDAGTGSGILALAAALAGHKVTAVDFDPGSIKVARENAARNRLVPGVRWVGADICKFRPGTRYDLIVANLFSDLLVRVLPKFHRWLKAGSPLILSGILREQENSVLAAIKRNGFYIRKRLRKGKWICLVLAKS